MSNEIQIGAVYQIREGGQFITDRGRMNIPDFTLVKVVNIQGEKALVRMAGNGPVFLTDVSNLVPTAVR